MSWINQHSLPAVEIEGETAYMHRRLINPRRPESTEQILVIVQKERQMLKIQLNCKYTPELFIVLIDTPIILFFFWF